MATYTEIHLRRDSALNWEAANPRLALGEPGVEMNTSGGYRIKVGNGIDRWKQLPYINGDMYSQLDEIQQKGYDKAQELLGKIEANKLDADTKHNALTTEVRNTSRELKTRMTAVEEEQAEYEESLTDEFTATKAEVHAGLEEFKDTRDQLTTRMDVIVGQSTDDTEILDARVDAEYQTHPNLGANIRHIHSEILSNRAQIAGLKANDELHEAELTAQVDRDIKLAEHGEFLQEQADDNAEAVIQTISVVQEVRAQNKADIERETYARTLNDEHLQEQADDNAEAVLNLSAALAEAMKDQKSPVNWSSADSLAIPEPRCAVVNFSGLDTMPTSKTADTQAVIEFWDMQGNFFKKNVILNAQGFTSLRFIKKNVKVDLLNDDGSEFDLKIGNWVSQDGFHLKAYYRDLFRGIAVASYKFWDDMMRSEGLAADRPYKKAMLTDNVEDLTLQIDTGALCHPDGFPCVVYLNGEFYGLFSWQLKKHRKNYHMDKSSVTHIHLDGGMYSYTIWEGVIDWTAFEIRNPNKLYTMDGKKYDGDNPKELIDETSEKYNPSNKDHVRSATVKQYIQNLADSFKHVGELYALYGNSSPERVRAEYGKIIDWESQRDYLIFSDVVRNSDGANGWNAQWFTYDGVKWYINAYDLDVSLGLGWSGTVINPPLASHIYTQRDIPIGYIPALYNTELEARYKELREAGIISVDNILNKLTDWTARIGIDNYELEYQHWPDSPCIVNFTDSLYRVKKWLETAIANMDRVYNYLPFTLEKMQEVHDTDMKVVRQEIAGASNLRQVYVEGLQEQIDQLAELRLAQLIKDYQDNKSRQIETEHERIRQQEQSTDIRGMFDEISEAVLRSILYDKQERETLSAQLDAIKEALSENGIEIPESASLMTNMEVNNMVDNVFNGSDSSDIEPQNEDEAEIFDMLDDVFNGTDTESYEDEVTDDLDPIFNP